MELDILEIYFENFAFKEYNLHPSFSSTTPKLLSQLGVLILHQGRGHLQYSGQQWLRRNPARQGPIVLFVA